MKDVENNDEIKAHFSEIEDFVKGLRGKLTYCDLNWEKKQFRHFSYSVGL